ncbi:MAG: hypothetical protein N3G19_00885 [Candidatus Pacearchaeota archaeon]|nr:hypothetical protein [Candidatus Pacearchaeota archaeon]
MDFKKLFLLTTFLFLQNCSPKEKSEKPRFFQYPNAKKWAISSHIDLNDDGYRELIERYTFTLPEEYGGKTTNSYTIEDGKTGALILLPHNGDSLFVSNKKTNSYKDLIFYYKGEKIIYKFNNDPEIRCYLAPGEEIVRGEGYQDYEEISKEFSTLADYSQKENQTGSEQEAEEKPMREEEQTYPIIYDVDEWIEVANPNYNLEYRVNNIYKKRIGWYDMWIERFGSTEGLRQEDIEAMKQRYYDLGIIDMEVRGTSPSLEEISMSDFKIYYPYECSPFLERTLLKMLNGTEITTINVSSNRGASFELPFIIYTNVQSSYQAAPEGRFRFGTKLDQGKTLVEAIFE